MIKKLPSLLTLIISIGINAAKPTGAATKINDILKQMRVIDTLATPVIRNSSKKKN